MDDREIVSLYWQRDERAIHETAAPNTALAAVRISKNILQDPFRSEENVNDAYMQLWNSIPPHRPQSLTGFSGENHAEPGAEQVQGSAGAEAGSG